jgi:hypothetical protein
MTKEIMETMNKATQKYFSIVEEHGMNNRLEELYSRKMDYVRTDIINKASACVRLGLISQSLVDTLDSQLRTKVNTTRRYAYDMYVQEFCDGSEHEADVQHYIYSEGWSRAQAEDFVNYLERLEEE